MHLKDVRLDLAREVQAGEVTYTDAVAGGMYVPLGAGDVDIAAIVGALEDGGLRRLVRPRAGHHPAGRSRRRPAWTRWPTCAPASYHILGVAGQRSGMGI